ncbi:oxygenase MpaB family protein [Zafaria sp. Z1313]|uniref:oxygenase MpaB family protein n=1 Tax=Zafaria sp. Z1313 TaxID=3423202 RepID=UPI003D303D50
MALHHARVPAPAAIADVAPESVLLLAAGRAVLLQLAHPAVGHGVARHSDFPTDPLKRLHGTLSYIYALTNGTPGQAAAVREWVDRAHAPVRSEAGADGTHPAYDARNPELQLWVAATLYDSALLVHEAVFDPLPPRAAEALYREYAVLGTALQMPAGAWPADRAAFRRYWNDAEARLGVDPAVRRVAGELLAARNAPFWIRAAMPVARVLTAGMLPARLREEFGLPYGPWRDRVFRAVLRTAAVLYPRLPRGLRHAPMHHYLRRLPAGPGA